MTAQQDQIQKALQGISTETIESELIAHLEVLLIATSSSMNVTMDRQIIELLERTDSDSDRIIELCCRILDRITVDLQPETIQKGLLSSTDIQSVTLRNIERNYNDFIRLKVTLEIILVDSKS